jgi:hypothetical protein
MEAAVERTKTNANTQEVIFGMKIPQGEDPHHFKGLRWR